MLIIYLNVGFRVSYFFLLSVVDYKKLRWQLTSLLRSTQRKSESGKSVPTSGLCDRYWQLVHKAGLLKVFKEVLPILC